MTSVMISKGYRRVRLPAGLAGKIGRSLRRGEWYESKMLNHITDLHIPGTYIDVGANVGNHSVYFAMNTAATRVVSIEPSPVSAGLCRQFADQNGLSDCVEVIEVAAGSEDAVLPIEYYIAEGTFGSAEVPVAPLDSLVQGPVSLIKMDIEGSEMDALKGASRILSQYRPRLFIEAHHSDEFEAIERFLSGFGYAATGHVFNSSPTYEFA